jgi:hypothetical protein
MKRLPITWLGTLLAVAALGVVAACMLGLASYDWCKKLLQGGWLRFKPQTGDQTRLSIRIPVTSPTTLLCYTSKVKERNIHA